MSTDPMRIVPASGTLNAETELICRYIGDCKGLEMQTVENTIVFSKPLHAMYGYPEPTKAMKSTHKTSGEP